MCIHTYIDICVYIYVCTGDLLSMESFEREAAVLRFVSHVTRMNESGHTYE